jgi:predicted NAD/FAD-binding protein
LKVAIIGTGISGLTCGYLLHKQHDITVYEAADYIGGHTNTIDVEAGLGIDTGFIVFNKKTYPNFVNMMDDLGVAYQPTDMSFSVKCEDTGLEYNGTNLNTLFAQRLNLFKPKFLSMVAGILDFNKKAKAFLFDHQSEVSLGEFIATSKINAEVVKHYLVPMAASVWSADPKQMMDFPALFMLRFWENHGFLEIDERPQWYVISGGSRSYIAPLVGGFKDKIKVATGVTKVERRQDQVTVSTESATEEFDRVIFANHSDQVLKILKDPSEREKKLLKAFPFQPNRAILHTDASVLPNKRLAWAAWNYHLSRVSGPMASLTYNMNILQRIKSEKTYNVTLNPPFPIDPAKIIKTIDYHHPVFTVAGVVEQANYPEWAGERNTFFCGAYLRNGFHEDGVVTAQRVCQLLGGRS